jgi:hypothetical protein
MSNTSERKEMARPLKEKIMNTQVSVRLEPKDFEDFNKLCHLEFSQMAPVARQLILEWIDKNKKKLK